MNWDRIKSILGVVGILLSAGFSVGAFSHSYAKETEVQSVRESISALTQKLDDAIGRLARIENKLDKR